MAEASDVKSGATGPRHGKRSKLKSSIGENKLSCTGDDDEEFE